MSVAECSNCGSTFPVAPEQAGVYTSCPNCAPEQYQAQPAAETTQPSASTDAPGRPDRSQSSGSSQPLHIRESQTVVVTYPPVELGFPPVDRATARRRRETRHGSARGVGLLMLLVFLAGVGVAIYFAAKNDLLSSLRPETTLVITADDVDPDKDLPDDTSATNGKTPFVPDKEDVFPQTPVKGPGVATLTFNADNAKTDDGENDAMGPWDGFNGLQWGIPVAELGITERVYRNDLFDGDRFYWYQRETEVPQIGEAHISTILYGFMSNKLVDVRIICDSEKSSAALKEWIVAQYGEGKLLEGLGMTMWEGKSREGKNVVMEFSEKLSDASGATLRIAVRGVN
jgi:hypothetical protein